jgi:uncharacterized protein YfaP (DUF2135 family)
VKRAALTGGVAAAWAVPAVRSVDLIAAKRAVGSGPSPTSGETTAPTVEETTSTTTTTTTEEPTSSTTEAPVTGGLKGRVVNALNGSPIIGATVTIVGTSFTTTTDSKGRYSFADVPVDTYDVRAQRSGFSTAISPVTLVANDTTTLNFALSLRGDLRLVLVWNTLESDLDLHLSAPTPPSGRVHVFFDQAAPVDYASLDMDDINGEGPETISVKDSPSHGGDFVAGDYHVWVDNFPTDPGDNADMKVSEATVTLFGRTMQVGQWAVGDASGASTSRLWHVIDFTIDADGTVTAVTPRNQFVAGDENTVL